MVQQDKGSSRLPQNAQRVCQVGSFNTANELASRQSKGVAQGVGKITTLPRLGIQVQGVNERPGLGPCNSMCRSRRWNNGNPGPWGGAYPSANPPVCGDCCGSAGGGARLGREAQQVCQKGSHNTAVAMAPGMRGGSRLGRNFSGMQGNCGDGYIELPNGGCIEEGLGDPSRQGLVWRKRRKGQNRWWSSYLWF